MEVSVKIIVKYGNFRIFFQKLLLVADGDYGKFTGNIDFEFAGGINECTHRRWQNYGIGIGEIFSEPSGDDFSFLL